MEIKNGVPTTLRQIGKDENWLQSWLADDPRRLGIGNVIIKKKELQHFANKGGRLDLLAYDAALDTYYEVEIMLGECDADHGFRVLDYWARERIRLPNCRHVAVLVAEDLSGRYATVIEALSQLLPLIAIELKTLQLDTDPPVATTFPIIFSQPDNLIVAPADEPEKTNGLVPNDEETWRANKPDFTEAAKLMYRMCLEKVGPSTIHFSAKSYISLKKGRRTWLPMWPRQDGFYVYIPCGPGGSEDQPNDFFARVNDSLAELGIEPSWSFKYNAGANPIAFTIARQNINHSKIIDILKEAYEFA